MKNIRQIIEGVENGSIDLENLDPSFHTEEYQDGADDVWISHSVERHDGIELLFAEHDEVKEVRKRIYEGSADPSEFEDMIFNEYSDRFNYDDVAGYKVGGKRIKWL